MLSKNSPTLPSSESTPVMASKPVLESPVITVSSNAGKRKRSLFEPQVSEEEDREWLETQRESHLDPVTLFVEHLMRREKQLADHLVHRETQFQDHLEQRENQLGNHHERLETQLEDHHEHLENQLTAHVEHLESLFLRHLAYHETQYERQFQQMMEEARKARQEEMAFRKEQVAQTADFHKELLGVLDRMAQATEPQKHSPQ
ncbi:sex-determining region Y protein-like [Engraulis encrasicolus]|uniref:sex-determining region Y protein-like n=1 Tax=Engraulis encrasicolus TaxID=184585 RepID=UPI002FD5DCEE